MEDVSDLDGVKSPGLVGMNSATSAWVPVPNCDVVPVATPLLTGCGSPRGVFPSRNCTVPAALAGVTTAFSLTKSPSCVVVSLVVVSAGPTTTVTGDSVVDVLNAVEPDTGMNVAVSECDPAANVGVATAMPLLSAG